MKQIDRMLVACGNKEVSLSELASMLKWKNNAVAVAIKDLVAKGYVRKPKHGFYIATKNGQEKIKGILDKEDYPYGIDSVIYRTAALFTTSSKFDIVETLKYEKESLRPSATTKELGDIIKKIYLESVGKQNFKCVDKEFIKSVWRSHTSPVCEECGFNFEKSYQKYEKELKRIEDEHKLEKKLDKSKIFKNLRWESYHDVEKYRRNFHLKTTYTEPELPENWNY